MTEGTVATLAISDSVLPWLRKLVDYDRYILL